MNRFDALYNLIMQQLNLDNIIYLEKITKFTEKELDLIHKGLNLSARASDDGQWSRQNLGQNLKKRIQYGHNYYYIKRSSEIIGIVQIGTYESQACISNFAIFEQYQGQHLGKQALQEIINFMKKKYPNRVITLGVARCNNKALSLYKKLGFKETSSWERGIGMQYKPITQSVQKYDPPYTEQQLKEHGYEQETIQRLRRDPVHSWRMQTGIQLIHRQPTKTQLQRIWKNWQLMTPQQKTKSNQKCMQLFGVTNQFLYGYLIPQYRADALGEKCDVQYPPIPLNQYVKANITNGKVYCCRPRLYERLEGSYTSSWSGEKGNIFVTPFKGIASCFVISKNSILRKFQKLGIRVQNCNFKYDVWNFPNEQLLDVKDTIKVTIERSGIKSNKVICGVSIGYLYTIDFNKYKDHCHMFNKNINSDVEFCIQGDVDYQSTQRITVKWTCNIQN